MTDAIFVDTNILVYARDSSDQPKQIVAARWLDLLWRDRRGRISVQVLNEYYVTVTRKLKPGLAEDEAWDDVQNLLAWDPQPINREVLSAARIIERRFRLSWWDSLIVAAAELQECTLLLSEDLQAGARYGMVTVRNPFDSSVAELPAPYVSIPKSSPQHRRPGRPLRAR
jgi:predicted nucleic acid-binding protein